MAVADDVVLLAPVVGLSEKELDSWKAMKATKLASKMIRVFMI